MSTYIGKNNSNENILHMTSGYHSESVMKSGLQDDTVFHSQRPYLTVNSNNNTPTIGYYNPPNINDDDSKGYEVYEHTDFGLEIIEYGGGGGIIDINKPHIMLCNIYTTTDGWIWVMGNTGPRHYSMEFYNDGNPDTVKVTRPMYAVNWLKSNSKIQVRVGFEYDDGNGATDTGTSMRNPAYKKAIPRQIILIQLTHELDDFSSTELDGAINISGIHGVSVGATNFFTNSYLTYRKSAEGENFYTPLPGFTNYLTLSHIPLSNSRVSVNLNSSSIQADNKEIFGPNHMYLRKIPGHVRTYNTTQDLLSISDFEYKYYNNFVVKNYLQGIGYGHWLAINLTSVFDSFSDSNTLAVSLRFKFKYSGDDNPRYKMISGIYSLDYPLATHVDLPNYDVLYEGSGLVRENDGDIYFICTANDVYESNNAWGSEGNVIIRKPGDTAYTDYVTELVGWIAELTGPNVPANTPITYTVISNKGSTEYKASEVYDTTKNHITDDGYSFDIDGSVLTSTNDGVDTSFSFIELNVTSDGTLTWEVSSEATYDLLYIWINEKLVINEPQSGEGAEYKTGVLSATNGDKISIAYSKDTSDNSGSDKAVITL